MKDALVIALAMVLSWFASVGHGFVATPPTRHHGAIFPPRHLSCRSSVSSNSMPFPNTRQDRIRGLLDETVLLYQVAMMKRLPSQDDVERLVCDVATALHHAALAPSDEKVILDDISQQMDELVMETFQLPDIPMKRVEALALEYCEVAKVQTQTTDVDADSVGELETRLEDLKQLVNVHRNIPLLLQDEMIQNAAISESIAVKQSQVAAKVTLPTVEEPLSTTESSQAVASPLGSSCQVNSKRYTTTLFASSDSSLSFQVPWKRQ